jgi:TolA-binding protein
MLKARTFVKKKNLAEAEKNYLIVINRFGSDILADNAIMELAAIYEYQLNEKAKALELYEKLIFEYTGSLFVVDARKNITRLNAEGIGIDKP